MKGLEGERLRVRTAESVETSNRGTVLKACWGVSLGGHISVGLYPGQLIVTVGGDQSGGLFSGGRQYQGRLSKGGRPEGTYL